MTVDELYQKALSTPSDINEHVPRLRQLAETVSTVTEFGTRWCVSTAAFLAARPSRFVAYDIQRCSEVDAIEAAARGAGIDFCFAEQNTLTAVIEGTDLLFIDTLHTYDQLLAELTRHAPKVRKYIVLHDTTTFGDKGELPDTDGLNRATREYFDRDHKDEWVLTEQHTNNNGLSIYERANL